MEERTKKFRTNCQFKKVRSSIRLLSEILKKDDFSKKDVYKLANGHKLPKEAKTNKCNLRLSKFKKIKLLNKITADEVSKELE